MSKFRILELCKQKGITQKDLAETIGMWSQKKEKALAFGLLILIRKWLVVFWYRRGV